MKSDKDFLEGVYRKARTLRQKEEHKQKITATRPFHWRGAAAMAACLLLLSASLWSLELTPNYQVTPINDPGASAARHFSSSLSMPEDADAIALVSCDNGAVAVERVIQFSDMVFPSLTPASLALKNGDVALIFLVNGEHNLEIADIYVQIPGNDALCYQNREGKILRSGDIPGLFPQ